jgi:hypothetical protein
VASVTPLVSARLSVWAVPTVSARPTVSEENDEVDVLVETMSWAGTTVTVRDPDTEEDWEKPWLDPELTVWLLDVDAVDEEEFAALQPEDVASDAPTVREPPAPKLALATPGTPIWTPASKLAERDSDVVCVVEPDVDSVRPTVKEVPEPAVWAVPALNSTERWDPEVHPDPTATDRTSGTWVTDVVVDVLLPDVLAQEAVSDLETVSAVPTVSARESAWETARDQELPQDSDSPHEAGTPWWH